MAGKIFITSAGYDPEFGKHVNDPYLDGEPSLGACRPDIRKAVKPGDHIFTITGKLPASLEKNQYIMCGFEVAEKIDALDAYLRFPKQRLKLSDDGQLHGNIIVDRLRNQHPLDQHPSGSKFDRRIKNFVVGKNLVTPTSPGEISKARNQTMDILRRVLGKLGQNPFELIGKSGKNLNENRF